MTTVRALLFIHKVWNIVRQSSSSHGTGQSMVIYHSCMNHAPSVVIVSWLRSEQGDISLKYETCFVSCHRLITTDRAWLYIPKVWTMLCQLSSSHDNGQSMVIHPLGMKHAPSVFIVSWQRTEHGYSSLRYETCSVSCHRLMTAVRTWLYIIHVWNMLRQLSSSYDNGQSMVIYLSSMKHAPSVVIVSWQRQSMVIYHSCIKHAPSVVIVSWQPREHGYTSLKCEPCSVSCHHLMATVRVCDTPSSMSHALSVVIITWQRSEYGDTPSSMSHALSVVIISWQRTELGHSSIRYSTCSVS